MLRRALQVYRKVTCALEAIEPFMKEFVFEAPNQANVNSLLHPADEKDLEFLNVLKVRDSPEAFDELIINALRGILKYALKEEDNPQKNMVYLKRFVTSRKRAGVFPTQVLVCRNIISVQGLLVRVHLPCIHARHLLWGPLHPLRASPGSDFGLFR